MNPIAEFVKRERKMAGYTQQEFALLSGLGLRFVRDLEQGKESLRMDKVNQALLMFGMEAVPGKSYRPRIPLTDEQLYRIQDRSMNKSYYERNKRIEEAFKRKKNKAD